MTTQERADQRLYMRTWRSDHRACGYCIHCNRPADSGFKTCAFHRSYYTRAQREHRSHRDLPLLQSND